MSNVIITISREFGSGGREIGEKLAGELSLPYYDKTIIQLAADRSGLSESFIEQSESKVSTSFLFNIAAAAYSNTKYSLQYDTPVNDKAFFAQASVVRDLAAQSSCIIIGRCADYILREEPNLVKVFIRGDIKDRQKRITEIYEMPEEGIVERVRKIDKSRANYHKYYTGETWGDIHNYDIVLNSSFTGIDGAVQVLKKLLNEKGYFN